MSRSKIEIEITESRKKDLEKLVKNANKYKEKLKIEYGDEREIIVDGAFSTKKIIMTKAIIHTNVESIGRYEIIGRTELLNKNDDYMDGSLLMIYETPFAKTIKKVVDYLEQDGTELDCDHCHSNRHRDRIYLVKDTKENKILKLGKGCLKEITKLNNVDAYINDINTIADFFKEVSKLKLTKAEITKEHKESEKKEVFFNTLEVLQFIKNYIKKNGYIARSKARLDETPTVNVIKYMLADYNQRQAENLVDSVDDSIKEQVKIFLENYDEYNNYQENLSILLQSKYVNKKQIGYLVGFFSTMEFMVSKIEEDKEKREIEFLGNVGDKIEVEGTFKDFKMFNGYAYGTYTYLYFFKVNNSILMWKTTKYLAENRDESLEDLIGKKVKIKAKIKEHNIYNDIKQTVITRAKIEM